MHELHELHLPRLLERRIRRLNLQIRDAFLCLLGDCNEDAEDANGTLMASSCFDCGEPVCASCTRDARKARICYSCGNLNCRECFKNELCETCGPSDW